MKKIIGSIFLIFGVYALVSGVMGMLEPKNVLYSQAHAMGEALAVISNVFAFAGSGIYFFLLDKSSTLSFMQSYKKRASLAKLSIACISVLFVIMLSVIKGAAEAVSSMNTITDYVEKSFWERYLGDLPYILLFILPIFIPIMIMGFMCDTYTTPFFGCKKALKGYEVNSLLEGEFKPLTAMKKNNVYTNGKAIYFSKTSVIIPVDNIKMVSKEKTLYYTGIKTRIKFELKNGKKVKVISDGYDEINKYVKELN